MEIAVVRGDGVGPAVVDAAVRVVEATGASIDWLDLPGGEQAHEELGTAVPEVTIDEILRCGVALKGPLTNPVRGGYPSPNMHLRRELGLYANVRVCRSVDHGEGGSAIDVVVIREMTEESFTGMQQLVAGEVGIAVKTVTRQATARLAAFVGEWARARGRTKVTIAHKSSAARATDGLFLDVMESALQSQGFVSVDEMMIDTAAMQLVRDPSRFDVVATSFQYGDILSDVCAGIIGSPAVIPGSTHGDGVVLFETVHGTAPKHAPGKTGNPIGMILAAALLLDHVGMTEHAAEIRRAASAAAADPTVRTIDFGGRATTDEVARRVIAGLGK